MHYPDSRLPLPPLPPRDLFLRQCLLVLLLLMAQASISSPTADCGRRGDSRPHGSGQPRLCS